MSKYDSEYQRTNRYGVEQERLVVWFEAGTKDKLRRIANDRRMPMGDLVNGAVAALIRDFEGVERDCE